MLRLPIHQHVRFILVGPHYPENVGAACRAMKTMGFTRAGLVRPSRLASPTHPMAQKMAVKSGDVLAAAEIFDNLDEAIVGLDLVVATTARRGVSGVLSPKTLGQLLVKFAAESKTIGILFGNEKTGLTSKELDYADFFLRAPLAADQPSLNLAQAVQIVAYELFAAGLEKRDAEKNETTQQVPHR